MVRLPMAASLLYREAPHSPAPMGGDFSGSCAVTSRNALLHNEATNATWSGHFYPEAEASCRSRVPGADLGGSLATSNFREFHLGELRRIYLPRSWVNRGRRRPRGIWVG